MPTYSHSRLSSFERCPLKYKYAYVEKIQLEEQPETVEAFMGKRVHEALCKLYESRIMSKNISLDELLAYYDGIWQKNWSDGILIVKKGQSAQDYQDKGKSCIAGYYRRYHPFDDSRTVGLEQMINFDIEGYKLIGYIDRLSQKPDGKYEIHDYKTSGKLPALQYFDDDRQLALYQIGVEKMRKDAEHVDLVWHFLVHDREMRSRRDRARLDRLKSSVVSTIKQIESAEAEDRFPAVKSELCRWCEYQSICPSCKSPATLL
jgi:putative RecB family exonuclease